MPAMLKGYFDRVWGPGIAFEHDLAGGRIKPLLTNVKVFGVVTSYGAPWWVTRFVAGDPGRKVLDAGPEAHVRPARALLLPRALRHGPLHPGLATGLPRARPRRRVGDLTEPLCPLLSVGYTLWHAQERLPRWAYLQGECVLLVDARARRQHDADLRRAREDMPASRGASLEPVGVVERAAAQSQDVRKSLQIQIERGAACAAEVQGDAFLLLSERWSYVLSAAPEKATIAPLENRLDQETPTP